MLVDVGARGLSGKQAEKALDAVGLTVNKNTIPFDPQAADGRLRHSDRHARRDDARHGSPRRWRSSPGPIARILEAPEDEAVRAEVRRGVRELCEGFPLVA